MFKDSVRPIEREHSHDVCFRTCGLLRILRSFGLLLFSVLRKYLLPRRTRGERERERQRQRQRERERERAIHHTKSQYDFEQARKNTSLLRGVSAFFRLSHRRSEVHRRCRRFYRDVRHRRSSQSEIRRPRGLHRGFKRHRKKREIIGRAAAPPGNGGCSSLARVTVRAIRALERATKHILLRTDVYSARGRIKQTHQTLRAERTHVDCIMETSHEKDTKQCAEAMSRLSMEETSKCTRPRSKGESRGQRLTGLTHECGVFGCIAAGDWPSQIDVGQIICLGLVALQHRGQESGGIVTSEGVCAKSFHVHKGMGMINNIFNDENMKKLKGNLGIGHTRYSTSAASEEVNCQPFVVHTAHGALAVAHNGELVNTESLRTMVLGRGVGLSTHSDSELITQALCLNPPEGEVNGPDWPARIKHLMQLAPLSYSLVIMQRDRIYGVRDPYGNRPLCLGKIVPIGNLASNESDDDDEAEGWVISSESCGFLSIGARYVREVFPGEIVELTREGIKTIEIVERPNKRPQAFCIFEYVYFARSDSIFEGQMVYSVRMQCGRVLAMESPVEADIVSSVPESGTAAAHGYARQSKINFAEVLCKNRYVGRTFIQPSTRLRQLGVAKKFGALSENVKGKRIILVDDSIVRGNTIGPIIKLLRDAGAKEVHVRIASPPLKYPCYMGINIPTREELIANKLDSVKLAKHVGADSLTYLSVEGLVEAVRYRMDNRESSCIGHCTACLTGEYPDEFPGDLDW